MSRFLVQGIKFISISVFIYLFIFALLFFIKEKNIPLIHRISKTLLFWGGDTFRRFQEFDVTENYDFLIIGSSHTYNGYDTRVFFENDFKVHNLGSSGQSLENTAIITRNYFHKSLTKNAIIDIYPGAMMSSGMGSTCDLIVNIPSNSAAVELAWSFPDIRSINMLTLRAFYHLSDSQQPTYNDYRYRKGGFIAVRDSVKTDLDYQNFLRYYKPTKKAINGLLSFVKTCKENGIKPILVAHPAPMELQNEHYLAFIEHANEIAKDNKVLFMNYTFDHDLNSNHHFYDTHHLNEAGAKIFTKKLISDLISELMNKEQ